MNFLYQAHSGLRYLVLLAGVASALAFAYGLATNRSVPAARGISAAFNGLLDLQILLGIGLVIGGIFYGALMGHLAMMLAAAAVAHITTVIARRGTDVRRSNTIGLAGVVGALLLIAFGIMAIGRSVLGTAAATMG